MLGPLAMSGLLDFACLSPRSAISTFCQQKIAPSVQI